MIKGIQREHIIIVFIMLLLSLLIIGGIIVVLDFLNKPIEYEVVEHPQMEKIKKEMARHGISVAECNGDDCWFYRDGKKVRLIY
jgi:flagellar basal body-associated protein FliL